MPKAAAAPKPEVGHGWTGLPASAADIAAACPAASREQLRSVLTDVALTGCVWRTQLRTVLQGVAHYANWLNIAGLNRDMFSERGVEAAIPAFVLRQFVDALSVLPIEHEAALELQAHAKALQWPAISASRDSVELEDAAARRRYARQSHHHMVCSGLIAGFYRSLESGPRTATAPASASDIDFADRCIAVCQDVASMYPDDLVPMLGGAEQSAFSMARRTAQNIEDRIKTLAHR